MRRRRRHCDGLARRDFIRVGGAGLFGMGLTLPEMLAREASAASTTESTSGGSTKGDVSLIVVFLRGGMSTIDTFDMKPDAPKEIRGEFNQISTNVPGIQVCEHLPRVAQQMDKFSLSLIHI